MSNTEFTTDNFKSEVLDNDKPVLVDFWAVWCGPCQTVAPIVEELAEQYKDQLKVGKLNIDDHQQIASQYGVMSIPTFIVFHKGQPIDTFVGALPKDMFVEKIEATLSHINEHHG